MPDLSKKILTAVLTVALAIAPVIARAFTVTSGSDSGQRLYLDTSTRILRSRSGITGNGNSSTSITPGSSTGGSSGGLSTFSSSYKGAPGVGTGNDNSGTGIDSEGSGSDGNDNSSSSIGSGGSGSDGNDNSSSSVGSEDSGSDGNDNSSSSIGSEGSGSSGNTDTGTDVSTSDSDYKGAPGMGGNTDTGTDVSTSDSDYRGAPGQRLSLCNGHYYPRDIDGHWAEIYIRRLYDLCIIEGYGDGTFRPNHDVTRAELVKMALYSKGIDPNPGCYDNDCGSPFMDLDFWQGKWIRPAWDRGVVQGYSHNHFKPNKSVTRAEAVKIILATYGYSPVGTSDSFFNDVHGWSAGWVEKAHEIGLVQGVGNGNFDPDRPITRAEAAKIIAKMMEYWDTRVR